MVTAAGIGGCRRIAETVLIPKLFFDLRINLIDGQFFRNLEEAAAGFRGNSLRSTLLAHRFVRHADSGAFVRRRPGILHFGRHRRPAIRHPAIHRRHRVPFARRRVRNFHRGCDLPLR